MVSRSLRLVAAVAAIVGLLNFAASAGAKPMFLLTAKGEFAKHHAQYEQAKASGSIVPPPSPCPQNGILPQPTVNGAIGVVPNCGVPELPIGAGEPYPGTMSYYGGHVQVVPREYIVYWGWGEKGAFSKPCKAEQIVEGSIKATLKCDPQGAGKYVANFLYNIGGTKWANVQNQYYEADPSGRRYINESGNLLAGIWVDDSSPGANLQKTSASNPYGPRHTFTDMALEATRAAKHFGVSGTALSNANFIIYQPQNFSDPQSASGSSFNPSNPTSLLVYCAFHDYTLYGATGNGAYNPKFGVGQHISYTNLPYIPNAGAGCGAGDVNQPGTLDGLSIALGHEVEETATDPGAEDVIGNATTGGTSYYGGWYDTLDGNENGDKCAYVGVSPLAGSGAGPNMLPMPGAMGDIKGKHFGTYAVQALWSNAAAAGTGWCAGVPSTDLPAPFSGEPPY